MSPEALYRLSEDPLKQGERALDKIRRLAFIATFFPIPIVSMSVIGFFWFQPHWYMDPFMVLLLGVFTIGQTLIFTQLRGVIKGVKNTAKVILVLQNAGDEPDLEKLRGELREKVSPGHLRDLVLRWIDLGLRGEIKGSEALMDNSSDRRSLTDLRNMSVHVSLNRTTLKLGFLGTLIGLVMTFPPMKRAILGLGSSDGELRFIHDIAEAIDGDQYAIIATLVATALSVLIELVTVQILERALGGFDLVNSHIIDWNLTRLQPWIRKKYGPDAKESHLKSGQLHLEERLLQAQAEMDKNIGHMLDAMARTSKHLESITEAQKTIGRRVLELTEFEKQYRSFIQTKQEAAAPTTMRTEKG